MADLRPEPVARRTRSSGRFAPAKVESTPNDDLDAAVQTPLPGEQPGAKRRGLGTYRSPSDLAKAEFAFR
jgi:hypothetical protein